MSRGAFLLVTTKAAGGSRSAHATITLRQAARRAPPRQAPRAPRAVDVGHTCGVPEIAAALPIARRGWRAALIEATGIVAMLGLIAASLVIAVDAAAAPSFLVPAGRHTFPGWLAGPLHGLHLGERTTWHDLGGVLIAMTGCWLIVLACVGAIRTRALVVAMRFFFFFFCCSARSYCFITRPVQSFAGFLMMLLGAAVYVVAKRVRQPVPLTK